jgi:shikimate dehydrogenase
MDNVRIGLIGFGISRSASPRLHGTLGRLYGVAVEYNLIDGKEIPGFEFDKALGRCGAEGYRGVNVTHPYKELAWARVRVDDPLVARIGAVNTVTFNAGDWRGTNTDFTGFAKAFRHRFGPVSPGTVLILGAGGVGKAMGFALGRLQVGKVQLFDVDGARGEALTKALIDAGIPAEAVLESDLADAIRAADGLVNGSPIGMWQHPGNPFPEATIGGQRWAFDAVYTPLETEFLKCARARGLEVMSGYDLLLFQGFDAFTIFTGKEVDATVALAALPPLPDA